MIVILKKMKQKHQCVKDPERQIGKRSNTLELMEDVEPFFVLEMTGPRKVQARFLNLFSMISSKH